MPACSNLWWLTYLAFNVIALVRTIIMCSAYTALDTNFSPRSSKGWTFKLVYSTQTSASIILQVLQVYERELSAKRVGAAKYCDRNSASTLIVVSTQFQAWLKTHIKTRLNFICNKVWKSASSIACIKNYVTLSRIRNPAMGNNLVRAILKLQYAAKKSIEFKRVKIWMWNVHRVTATWQNGKALFLILWPTKTAHLSSMILWEEFEVNDDWHFNEVLDIISSSFWGFHCDRYPTRKVCMPAGLVAVSQSYNLRSSALVLKWLFYRRIDIVDNMLQKLEKYADNLENLVQQRTAELEDEKLKTEMLLHRMLPPLVSVICLIKHKNYIRKYVNWSSIKSSRKHIVLVVAACGENPIR